MFKIVPNLMNFVKSVWGVVSELVCVIGITIKNWSFLKKKKKKNRNKNISNKKLKI